MGLNPDKVANIEDYIRKSVKIFQSSHEEQEVTEEEIQILVSSLVNGDIRDLGGLVALRGFVYQYYVAMNYMIDMLHSSKAWWEAVVFELLDDTALISHKGVRFIQVKTGREDGRHKIKASDLYSRKNGLNSWLDKLFLNIINYQTSQKDVGYELNIDEDFKVELEIATNYPSEYDNYLEAYFRNINYSLFAEDKHKDDTLLEKLQAPLHIYETQGKQRIKIDTKYLENELTPFKVDWCLQRLYINNLGYFPHLEKEIKCKIQDILGGRESALNSAIAECIMQSLLSEIVLRTHDDSPYLDKRKLLFTREELKKLFSIWRKEAEVRIYEDVKQSVLLAKFSSCVDELREDIKRTWTGEAQKEILDRLDWIYLQLLERFRSNNDVDTYEKFLNRLFEMRNYNIPISLDRTSQRKHLIKSLEYMSVCLSFYSHYTFPYENSGLLFKKGVHDTDQRIFATFNAREEIEFDIVKRRIVQTIRKCPITQRIQEDYYCIVIDPKEAVELETDPFASLIDISASNTDKKITDTPPNIHFVNPSDFQRVIKSFQKHSDKLSFQNQAVRNIWNREIEKHKVRDGIG